MKLMEEDFPVNRFAESKKIASLYDLLAIIIGGDAEKSLTKAGNVVRECVDANRRRIYRAFIRRLA